jgi:membrane peptidoglycan carboxypeptidase
LIVNQVMSELAGKGWQPDALKTHGAQIYTTIQPTAMTQAENAISSRLASDAQFTNGQPIVIGGKTVTPNGQPVSASNPATKGTETAALVSIDQATGEIVAYDGGNDKNATQIDMAKTPHQAGSSFKPYVLAAGLEYMPDKIGLNSVYKPTSPQVIEGVTVHNAEGDGCDDPCTVKSAMTNSLNVVFYTMGAQVGQGKVRDAALQAGIAPTLNGVPTLQDSNGQIEGGIAIGQYEVRPIDQAQGYATIANGGEYIPAHFVRKVTDNTGVVLYQFNTPPKPAFGNDPATSASIAKTVSDSLTDIAASSKFPLAKGRPADAKTGTQDFKAQNSKPNLNYDSQAWTVGFTPQVVTAVWFGHYDIPGPIFGHGNGGPAGIYSVFGREEPGQIWRTYMDSYLADQPIVKFPTSPADIGGDWDFVNNVDASSENTPQTTAPPTGDQPPGGQPTQTSDQPTQPVDTTDTTTKHHGPPPTSAICNPIIEPCNGNPGGGGGNPGGP